MAKNLLSLGIGSFGYYNNFKDKVSIFGDTRQYEVDRNWDYRFDHPQLGKIQTLPVTPKYTIDLRRPAYFRKLKQITVDGSRIIMAADVLSLAGVLPLLMGMDFVLVKAVYTPLWAVNFVRKWDNGWVIDDISRLPDLVDKIMVKTFLQNQL